MHDITEGRARKCICLSLLHSSSLDTYCKFKGDIKTIVEVLRCNESSNHIFSTVHLNLNK